MKLRLRATDLRRTIVLGLCALTCCVGIAVAAGCGSSPARTPSGTRVGITERDFRISLASTHVAAGAVVLRIHNAGPDQHELIMVRSGGSQPTLRRDGLTVDEEALHEVGAVEGVDPHGVGRVRLHLAAGRYELFCNMAGHFMAGMRTELVVGG